MFFLYVCLGAYDDGWLYVYINRVAPPLPSFSFNITINEEQALYQSILQLPTLTSGAVYRITGDDNSNQFFGSLDEALVVIRPLIYRNQGQNR